MKIRPHPINHENLTATLEPGDRIALVDADTHERLTDIITMPTSGQYMWFPEEIRSDKKRNVTWAWKDEDDITQCFGYPIVVIHRPGDSITVHDGSAPSVVTERFSEPVKPVSPLLTALIVLGLSAVGWVFFSALIFLVKEFF